MRLVLFDIDGTLLTARGAGRRALGRALAATYGTPGRLDGYDFRGRTDRRIVADLMTGAGIPRRRVQARMRACFDAYAVALAEEIGDGGLVRLLPGVGELVRRLGGEPDVVLGLVTGNTEEGARIKLGPTGLWPTFRAGAYGSEHSDRRRLPGLAARRARALTGHAFRPADVLVLGDTPHDVECARAFGAVAVAVATGQYSRAELAESWPDLLFDTFADVEATIRALREGAPTRVITRRGHPGFARPHPASTSGKDIRMATRTASDLDSLTDLNRDYIRSVQTSDVNRFDEILAEDFLCSNPDGSLVDRAAFLAQTAMPVKISGLEAHDVLIRIMGDFAIIHARTAGSPSPLTSRAARRDQSGHLPRSAVAPGRHLGSRDHAARADRAAVAGLHPGSRGPLPEGGDEPRDPRCRPGPHGRALLAVTGLPARSGEAGDLDAGVLQLVAPVDRGEDRGDALEWPGVGERADVDRA
jgi:phosphoglycolate phosphatase